LPRPPLRRLLGSSDGSLWIAGAGLAELKAGGELRRYHQLDSMDISELIEDKDGAIWAGGDGTKRQSPKLCRVYRGESECFPLNEFMGSDIWALHEDGKGQLWVCTNIGVWRLRKGSPQKFAPLSRGTIIRAFDEDATGTLIFSDGSK